MSILKFDGNRKKIGMFSIIKKQFLKELCHL